MRIASLICPVLLALGSCTSPPKPPTVDPSTRRPVNVASEVELQVCKGELQNTRILASETTRRAETARSAAIRLTEQHADAACSRRSDAGTNAVYTILFTFGSTDVMVPSASASELIERARQAELIVARGRTDGEIETAAESRIARERAAAVRAYLVQSGIDPARIRTSYQPIGDHAANNSTAAGRALNRRVEIEIYSAPPQVVRTEPGRQGLSGPPTPSRGVGHGRRPRTGTKRWIGRTRQPGRPSRKSAFQTPMDLLGERYEVRDPFAEVTYRARTSQEMAAKAEQLGAIRFYAVDMDGKRTPINKVEGEWRRAEPPSTRATEHDAAKGHAPASAPVPAVQKLPDADLAEDRPRGRAGRASGTPPGRPDRALRHQARSAEDRQRHPRADRISVQGRCDARGVHRDDVSAVDGHQQSLSGALDGRTSLKPATGKPCASRAMQTSSDWCGSKPPSAA
jgi:outer membrane protein OmpA-like peptidoglycan-associated protein